jgi:hypothetical protein
MWPWDPYAGLVAEIFLHYYENIIVEYVTETIIFTIQKLWLI